MKPGPGDVFDCSLCPSGDEDGQNISYEDVVAHYRRFHPEVLDTVQDDIAARRRATQN